MTKTNETFTSRWGDTVADDFQWCQVPGYVLRNYHNVVSETDVLDKSGNLVIKRGQVIGLGMVDIMFVIHVMAFKYDSPEGKAEPGLPTIAEYAGIHITSIRRIKQRLEEYGLMTTIPQPGRPDVYNFKPLHSQCVRLQEGKSPIEGVETTPRKIASGSKSARGWASKSASPPLANPRVEESLEVKKENLSAPTTRVREYFTLAVYGGQDCYSDGRFISPENNFAEFLGACNDIFYAWLDALDELGKKPDTALRDLWAKHKDSVKALAMHRRMPQQVANYVKHVYSDQYQDDFYKRNPSPITLAAISGAIGSWLNSLSKTQSSPAWQPVTVPTTPAAVPTRTPEETEQLIARGREQRQTALRKMSLRQRDELSEAG